MLSCANATVSTPTLREQGRELSCDGRRIQRVHLWKNRNKQIAAKKEMKCEQYRTDGVKYSPDGTQLLKTPGGLGTKKKV